MDAECQPSPEEAKLAAAIDRVLSSSSRKKLIVAGPGTGKTSLFRRLLESADQEPDRRLVLTFINSLKEDLERALAGLAQIHTLHSFCLGLLHRDPVLRHRLPPDFQCLPGLAHLIAEDWRIINECENPQFVNEMRKLGEGDAIPFYLARGDYYGAVDFDDTVYRVLSGYSSGAAEPHEYELVLIDEYQDFNPLEAALIDSLAARSPILIAGDDDQALYSQLRSSTWDHIRQLPRDGEFEVFELPYCLRCPEVVVNAVNDVVGRAKTLKRLDGRIEKPYKYFPPVKEADSRRYPEISLVETTVQRANANYMGRYIAAAIAEIPEEEILQAQEGGYPAALVIAAEPYRGQILSWLEGIGLAVDSRQVTPARLERELGLAILKSDNSSSLGWRVVLNADNPPFLRDSLRRTADNVTPLVKFLPKDYCDKVLAEAEGCKPHEESDRKPEGDSASEPAPLIRISSFEGAKGLSAQHVFVAGLHNQELPRDPSAIQDLEVCKFVVALTRTRKHCSLVYTRNFAGNWKTPSEFIRWIDASRLAQVKVNAQSWR